MNINPDHFTETTAQAVSDAIGACCDVADSPDAAMLLYRDSIYAEILADGSYRIPYERSEIDCATRAEAEQAMAKIYTELVGGE